MFGQRLVLAPRDENEAKLRIFMCIALLPSHKREIENCQIILQDKLDARIVWQYSGIKGKGVLVQGSPPSTCTLLQLRVERLASQHSSRDQMSIVISS